MDADFQKRITSIFDYTYSNTAIRVPSLVGIEVGKILHTGLYREEHEAKKIAFDLSPITIKAIQAGDKTVVKEIADGSKRSFEKMNRDLNLYEENIRFEDSQLAYIVSFLAGINFSNKTRDYFGDALEIFRSTWAKQEGGQFFTDQLVTSLALELIQFDPRDGDDLVDLCAGTGGFLLAGFHRIRELLEANKGTEKQLISLASKSLRGIEIDEQIADVGNSTLSARLGSKEKKHIFTANSLDSRQLSKSKLVQMGTHKCAATNPPFGAKILVRDLDILDQYELARLKGGSIEDTLRTKDVTPRSPDILFIEQNVKLLKPGLGRLGIVMPYQLLSGPQATYIRYWILLHCSITAVVDLPSETFQPHTGTKTSLVILKRRSKPLSNLEDAAEESIFMASPQWIGHDRRGNPVFERDREGRLTDKILTDFHQVEEAFNQYLSNKAEFSYKEAYVVSVNDVLADKHLRINAMFYRQKNRAESISSTVANPENWQTIKLGSVVKRIFYPGRFKRSYVEKYPEAVPFLGGSNITELISESGKWMRPDDPHIEQLKVRAGWILVTRSGSTGIVSTVPPAWDGFAMSEHVIRIIPDDKKMPSDYIYAYLKSKLGQLELSKGIFGSVIEEISPEGISEIEIKIPKDKKLLKKIVSEAHLALEKKNEAILHDTAAIRILEELF